jgi:magnesium-transporting ATPase (P-type)
LAVRELLVLAYFNQNPNNVVNSIEKALFDFAKKNLNLPELGKAYKIIEEIEFNSTNKFHVILLEPVDNDIHLKMFGYTKDYQNKKVKKQF